MLITSLKLSSNYLWTTCFSGRLETEARPQACSIARQPPVIDSAHHLLNRFLQLGGSEDAHGPTTDVGASEVL
jgi:hypothetical protein